MIEAFLRASGGEGVCSRIKQSVYELAILSRRSSLQVNRAVD